MKLMKNLLDAPQKYKLDCGMRECKCGLYGYGCGEETECYPMQFTNSFGSFVDTMLCWKCKVDMDNELMIRYVEYGFEKDGYEVVNKELDKLASAGAKIKIKGHREAVKYSVEIARKHLDQLKAN